MRVTDSHCHLESSTYGGEAGVDAVVERARAQGVERLVAVVTGHELSGWEEPLRVADRHPHVRVALGLHPHEAAHWSPAHEQRLRAAACDARVAALGEVGLDFHYDHSPRDVQRTVLRAQVRLALELDMPLVIHDRQSDSETFRILTEEQAFGGPGVLYHCFTGTVPEMEAIVEAGGHVSLSGIVTFKTAGVLREVAARVPSDRLLVETDAPYLAPVPHRGKTNEPAWVPRVVEEVALARGVDRRVVAELSWNNAAQYFRWTDPGS